MLTVVTIGSGSKTQMQARFKVVIYLFVGRSHRMMGFIRRQDVKIVRIKFVEPANQALNRSGNHFLTIGSFPGLFDAARAFKIFNGLVYQFFAVGQDKYSATAFDLAETDRFSKR